MKTRINELREEIKSLPSKPGVYMWLDSNKKIIYVGKAKNLRARVLSYLREDGDGRLQLPWLMSQAAGLDYIVTGSEIEALVTEANLVRAKKPKFNVRLKDDKRYPYIKITKEAVPRIYLTRTIGEDGSRYLGPYTDVKAVRRTLKIVHTIFPLRYCREVLPSKSKKRACLNYQIKRCSGPCVGYISLEEYNNYIEDAYQFIIGRNDDVIKNLKKRMKEASDGLDFEHASKLRDKLLAVRKITERRKAFSTTLQSGDRDIVNYHVIDNEATVVIMEIRNGMLLGKKDYNVGGVQYTSQPEMLAQFLAQYYLKASWLPPEIHLPEIPADADNFEKLFSERRSSKFNFVYPKRGEKLRLLKMTAMNAEMILTKTLEKRDRIKDAVPNVISALQRDLRLKKTPRTIACIDISHLHGTDTVGSLVFFRDGRPEKSEYRHFKITTVDGIDDFGSMREVVKRYFTRRLDEKKDLPDLLLVDGGKGQLSSAKSILDGLGLNDQAVAGLAKRLEEIFLPGLPDPQNIPKTSSSIHLLQRVRDEAHRFAITYQKKLRKKRTIASSLSNIEGIGIKKTVNLLKHFGSVEAVRNADKEEIAKVPGIGPKLADVIYNWLNRKKY
ncbi:MAG TPA: excinuclease ABC subunit UvrC [bacterium]|nr:excinuclease ABC subunit UvrC [bacterium]